MKAAEWVPECTCRERATERKERPLSFAHVYEFEQHGIRMVATNGKSDGFVDITIEHGDSLLFDVIEIDPSGFVKDPEWMQIFVDGWRNGDRASASRLSTWLRRFNVAAPDPRVPSVGDWPTGEQLREALTTDPVTEIERGLSK